MMILKGKELKIIIMVMFMKVILKMDWKMDKVKLWIEMGKYFKKVFGKMDILKNK